jgi:hypothetical protein
VPYVEKRMLCYCGHGRYMHEEETLRCESCECEYFTPDMLAPLNAELRDKLAAIFGVKK